MVLLYQLWLALSERKVMNKNRVNGSIVEKNEIWYARLYVTDENGKRKQIWRTTKLPVKNNKRKAEAFLQDLIEQYSKECKTFYSEITVADYFELWLNDIKSEVRPNTYRNYKGNMEKHIIPYFREKGIRLQELKPCDLTAYYKFKNNTNSKLEKAEPLSPRTIQHHHQNISKALNDAVEKGYINFNPDVSSKRPKLKTFNAKFLNQKQINNMLTAIENEIIYLPVLLCSIYGLRRSEVLGIKWSCVDFENNTIHICETLQQSTKELTGESNYTDDTKNASSNRTMPLIPVIKEKLLVQKQWQIENKKEFEELYSDSDFVFTHENGSVMTPNYLTKNFRKIADSLGYYGLRLHDLRHPYVKHTTKIFSLRLMDFQAQAYPDARRKTRGACQLHRGGQSQSPVRPLCNRKRFSYLPPQSKMSWILYAISMRLSGYTSTRSISSSASSVVSVSASKIALDASLRLSCRACSSCFCFACANTAA